MRPAILMPIAAGVPRDHLYNSTMYILCAMLIAGLICNYMVKPVDPKCYMSEADIAKLQAASASADTGQTGAFGIGTGGLDGKAALFWLFRRRSAGLGRVDHPAIRREDLPITEHE